MPHLSKMLRTVAAALVGTKLSMTRPARTLGTARRSLVARGQLTISTALYGLPVDGLKACTRH